MMSNLTRCADCGAVVSRNALACPNCGAAGYHAVGSGWLDYLFTVAICVFGAYVAFGLDLGFLALSKYAQYIRLIGMGVLAFGLYTLYALWKDKNK